MTKIFQAYNYQKPIIGDMIEKEAYGCFAFPGSGKTPMSLEVIYHFKHPTLIICPLPILYATWSTEHSKWDNFNNLKLSYLHGAPKETDFNKKAGVFLINPEGIVWLFNKIKSEKKFPFVNLFIDESVKFKNPKSKRFKALCKLAKHFKRRYLLCGNPIPNGYLDLWAQIYILDFGERLGNTFYKYRNKYFYPTDYRRFNWDLKPGAKEEILEKISDITTFLTVEDTHLELPQRVENTIMYSLPDKSRKIYNTMEKKLFSAMDEEIELVNENEDNKLVVDSRVSALMKCRQIAQGFIYENYEHEIKGKIKKFKKIHEIDTTLLDLCIEHVESIGDTPIVIAYWFEQDLNYLKKGFPNAEFISDAAGPDEIKRVEEHWNAGRIPILVSHMNKISHGLNLQYGIGHHIILYSLTYNFDTYDQLILRFERQGAEYDNVFVTRFAAENTVHLTMLESLKMKERTSDEFFELLRKYKKLSNK